MRDCLSGFIFDSTPVDFTSDLGIRFILHPTVLKMSRPPPLTSWLANAIASSLDCLFLSRFEAQRAEYWQTLFSTVVSTHCFCCRMNCFLLSHLVLYNIYIYILFFLQSIGAPYLIFCSEDDELAPCHIICNFSQRIQQLGGDVELVKWCTSSHVGMHVVQCLFFLFIMLLLYN